jgi:hypothetical protein
LRNGQLCRTLVTKLPFGQSGLIWPFTS